MQVDVDGFQERGYVNVSGLFSDDEVTYLRQHYMDLRRNGSYPGDHAGVDTSDEDPLKRFPRMIHMHRWGSNQPGLDAGSALGSRIPPAFGRRAPGRTNDVLFQAGRRARTSAASGPILLARTTGNLHRRLDGY